MKKFTFICANTQWQLLWSGNESENHLTAIRFPKERDSAEHEAVKNFCAKAKAGWTHITKDKFAMIVCTEDGESGE